MRAHSFCLAFLTVISLLSLTFANPVAPGGVLYYNKRYCQIYACRLEGEEPIYTITPSPARAVASPTLPASSIPTPTLDEPQSGAVKASGSGSILEPSLSPATGFSSDSANAGVALASHGTLFCMVVAGLLGMALAF